MYLIYNLLSVGDISDQDQAMVGYEMIQTIGNATTTYKFTPKYVLKARQKVMVRVIIVLWLATECSPPSCLRCCAVLYTPTLE